MDALRERQQEWRKAHRGRFLGLRKLGRCKPWQRPQTTETQPSRHLRVTGKETPGVLKAAIDKLRAFIQAYRLAYQRFTQGHRHTEFPAGTYWLRKHIQVCCAPCPA